jgi:hypothetical protein
MTDTLDASGFWLFNKKIVQGVIRYSCQPTPEYPSKSARGARPSRESFFFFSRKISAALLCYVTRAKMSRQAARRREHDRQLLTSRSAISMMMDDGARPQTLRHNLSPAVYF